MNIFHKALRRLRGQRDYLDGLRDGLICGWALPAPGAGPVPVALFAGPTKIAETLACQFRTDLQEAGLAGGQCGFVFPAARGAPDLRVLRLDGARPREIGRLTGEARPAPLLLTRPTQSLRDVLGPGITALRSNPRPAPEATTPLTRKQAALFDDATLPAPLFAYASHLTHRHRLEETFDWTTHPEDAAHFLNWMLASYAPMRAPLKPPLSRRAIQWLNAPHLVAGQATSLSRATWAFLMGVPHLRQGMDFDNPDWVESVIYWWSVHQARAVGAEDCLVPAPYVSALAKTEDDRPFALSRYMLRWVAETPALAGLSTTREADRRQITLAAMTHAAAYPDTLRYLPWANIETFLHEGAGGQTPLGAYLTSLDGQSRLIRRTDYITCLRGRGYDMELHRFTTRTIEGHRLHALALPAPALHAPKIDVQVIGPVTKASGLGQATRASVAALKTTGLSVQVVDFALDNPAPDIDAPHTPITEARPARFSLLHLNAESLPLLPAYAPDITQGSYSAAYMFWELTRAPACHALALSMVDEIWAASDHGKAIYAPAFDGPVRTMGLACDLTPPADPLGARAAFVAHSGFAADSFLCMASFDSFSFVQRKNPLALIHAFRDAFPEGGAQLLLKTQNRTRVGDPAQQAIWAEIDALITDDPRFCLLDETMRRDDLLTLTAGADAYLSLHRAEGWGFGMIEAMAMGVPVLATGYSGNLAYSDDSTAWLVPATEVAPDPQDYMFTPDGGLWGQPNHEAAVRMLRQMRAAPEARKRKAALALQRVRHDFSPEAIGTRYSARIETVLRHQTGQAA